MTLPFSLRLIRWFFPKLESIAPRLATRFFIRIFFSPFRYPRPEKEKPFVQSAEKWEWRVNNKRVQGYSWGHSRQPYVLVVHGWAGRATQFRKFIPVFNEAGYGVVGFDGPAHGLSEGTRTNILEFEQLLRQVFQQMGQPAAVITHSFGGVAALYAMAQGLPVHKLVNIASPTIGDEVISTYLRAINGSARTGQAFKAWMVATYRKTFDEFSGLHLARQIQTPFSLLLWYDEDDKEVTKEHGLALKKVFPAAELMVTKGLGHNRILKDDAVIARCLAFVKQA